MKPVLFSIAAGLLGLAAGAFAQDRFDDARERPGPMRPMLPDTRAQAVAGAGAMLARFDKNRDGVLARAELPGGGADDHSGVFDRIDRDRSGQLSRAEFDAFHTDRGFGKHGGRHGRGEIAERMFAQADADRDGRVTPAEAERAAGAWFDRADTDRDGRLSEAERRAARAYARAQWGKDRFDRRQP